MTSELFNTNKFLIMSNMKISFFSIQKIITRFMWLLFICIFSYVLFNFSNIPQVKLGDLFRFNGFVALIWSVVTFFSGLIASYSENYLSGFRYQNKFSLLSLGFMLSIMVFVSANHILIFLAMWLLMGFIMSRLIGVHSDWGEAKEASKFAFNNFLLGSLFLSLGLVLLALNTNSVTLSDILANLNSVPHYVLLFAALFVIIAAIVQSAIFPFHKWLLSAMTAPTPASALMHAGFVNGSGILLTLLAVLLVESKSLNILFLVGGLTAILAQFTKLIQVQVKQKLACSTIAQMGFMIMQCGLGFFNAAIAHLILHGFYKAYLFLSSGEEIKSSDIQKPLNITIKPLQALVVLFFGIMGAFLFNYFTGKSFALDSSLFLTLIVAITVGQATYNIVKEKHLTPLQKTFLPTMLFFIGISTYALMYNAVTILMDDMAIVSQSYKMSFMEVVFGVIFFIGFFIMKLGFYKNYPWLYVKLLNMSQPQKKTILMYKP